MLSSGSLNLGKTSLVSRRDHLALISLLINQPGVHNPGTCRVNTLSVSLPLLPHSFSSFRARPEHSAAAAEPHRSALRRRPRSL